MDKEVKINLDFTDNGLDETLAKSKLLSAEFRKMAKQAGMFGANQAKVVSAMNKAVVKNLSSKDYNKLKPNMQALVDKTKSCVIMDCYSGSAQTGKVANQLGHSYIGYEVNYDYILASELRIFGNFENNNLKLVA
jgi:hypothetical protein